MAKKLSEYRYVYYASYGSNLDRDRFLVYIEGGTPKGSTRWYRPNLGGTQGPTDDVFFTSVDWTVTFARKSTTWLWPDESGGGMAFLIPRNHDEPPARLRGYCIKSEQFIGVVQAENTPRDEMDSGLPLTPVPELNDAILQKHWDLPSLATRTYPRLVWLGMYKELPVLTFTCSFFLNPPTPEYVRTIVTGLCQTHLHDENAIVGQLKSWNLDYPVELIRSWKLDYPEPLSHEVIIDPPE
jgi:hypothetical protein